MSGISVGVGLFIYNRPWHTLRVLESLKQAGLDYLYVFADAPADGVITENIEKTRALISGIKWCKVDFQVRDKNMRTIGNVSSGIDYILRDHEAVIVLEDDCVVRPDYLTYMNAVLSFYKDDTRVFHVNGYQLPIVVGKDAGVDVYQSPLAMSWGFGLYKRAWKYFRLDVADAPEFLKSPAAKRLLTVVPDFDQRMQALLEKRVSSWTYRWNFLINKHGGICVSPYQSYVHNIGWDGDGVNCSKSTRYDIPPLIWQRPLLTGESSLRLTTDLKVDGYMDQQTSKYYRRKPALLLRLYRQWQDLIKGRL